MKILLGVSFTKNPQSSNLERTLWVAFIFMPSYAILMQVHKPKQSEVYNHHFLLEYVLQDVYSLHQERNQIKIQTALDKVLF